MNKDNLKTIPRELWKHRGFRRDVRQLMRVPEAQIAGSVLALIAAVVAVLSFSRINFFETVLVVLAGVVGGYTAVRPLKGAGAGLVVGGLVFLVGLFGPIPHIAWALPITLWVLALGTFYVYWRRFNAVARIVFFTDHLRSISGDGRNIRDMFEKNPARGLSASPLPLVWNAQKAALKPEAQAGIIAAGRQVFGVPIKLTSLRADITVIEETEEAKPEEKKDPFIERMENVLTSTIGSGVKVLEADYDESDDGEEVELVSMTFTWPASLSSRLAQPGRQAIVVRSLSSALEQSVRVSWKTAQDKGVVRPVGKLPTGKVNHPPREQEIPETFIRFGVGEGDKSVGWDMDADDPHCLVVGVTGKGKTSFLRTFLTEVPQETKVLIADIRQFESFGFEQLPQVEKVARTVDEIAAMIDEFHDEMMRRSEQARNNPSLRFSMPYKVLLLDELANTFRMMDTAWKEYGKEEAKKAGLNPGTQHPAKAKLTTILGLSRAVRMRVMLLTQQGDATILPTEARGNCGTRIALGNVGPESSGMVFDDRKIATKGLENVRGRAWIRQSQGQPVEQMQIYWTPPFDPEDPACGPEGAEILRGLGVEVNELTATVTAAETHEKKQAADDSATMDPAEPSDEPGGHADNDASDVEKSAKSVDEFPIDGNVCDEGDNPPSQEALPPEDRKAHDRTIEQRPTASEQTSSSPETSSPDRDTTPTNPLDIDEGAQIVVEHPDTQEMIDAVVKDVSIDPDDASLIALEWSTHDGDAGVYVVDEDDTVLVITPDA